MIDFRRDHIAWLRFIKKILSKLENVEQEGQLTLDEWSEVCVGHVIEYQSGKKGNYAKDVIDSRENINIYLLVLIPLEIL